MKFKSMIFAGLATMALAGCGGSGGSSSNGLAIFVGDGNPRVVRFTDMTGSGWNEYTGDLIEPFTDYISDIEFDAAGNFYVADPQASKIWMFSAFGDPSGVSFGTFGSGVGQLGRILQIAIDDLGRIYILDTDNDRVVRIDNITGAGWVAFGASGSGAGQFQFASGIDVDSSERIYVGDVVNDRIARFDDMAGTGWTTFGTSGSGTGEFDSVVDIHILGTGSMLIADRGGRVIMTNNMSATNWTSFNENTVQAVAMDSLGRIYTVNQFDDVVRRRTNMADVAPVSFGSTGSGANQFDSASCIVVRP